MSEARLELLKRFAWAANAFGWVFLLTDHPALAVIVFVASIAAFCVRIGHSLGRGRA